ncbi:short-chain dehydrogenase [Mycolicibacterium moriokaense]|nr:SDR family oxidoreductase [Mycolicibacterium moriokaense]MCV7039493.1 SDR family oxidoreductase [Mycolicibacterium moriokaense]ORB26937.1 short-chain dehydrogenase [Mycolicibacterium moriokaense]
MTSLTGKTALVTGASRGIGRAIAQRLAADGALVAVHYGSNDAAAAETIDAIRAAGGEAFPVRAFLGVDGDVETLFGALEKELDGRPLDILVNNAAISTAEATVEKATPEQFDREFAINVRAPFFITQRALPLLRDGGRIINISSGVTWFATPQIVYSMTKGALNVLGRSLANTLGERGITVNNIAPGVTDTDMNSWLHDSDDAPTGFTEITALDRIGAASEIADAVAFFASDDSRWVTGQTLDVNGGLYLGPRTPLLPS